MSYYKELMIEVCEAVEKETGVEFDVIQGYIMDNNPELQFGDWYVYHFSNKWIGFSEQQINPVKIVIRNSLKETMKDIDEIHGSWLALAYYLELSEMFESDYQEPIG